MAEETPGSETIEEEQKRSVVTEVSKGTTTEPPKIKSDIWSTIPQWFVPFIGFIYATGYLVTDVTQREAAG
jgi:hypothetical protein